MGPTAGSAVGHIDTEARSSCAVMTAHSLGTLLAIAGVSNVASGVILRRQVWGRDRRNSDG